MTHITSSIVSGKPPDPIPLVNPDPLLSCNRARVFLAGLKGCLKLDHETLIRLVKCEGLPYHMDPFGSGHWCFLASELLAWFADRMAGSQPKPIRGPGRPRKDRRPVPPPPSTRPNEPAPNAQPAVLAA